MNDPGMDEPIAQATEDADVTFENQRSKEEQDEDDFLDPSRWWFASTACPLLAGTFGPMANAFSICALVENWRVYVPPGITEAHGNDIKDPSWLLAINGVSLACALIANFALLLNMARRLSFTIAQPITIVGWLVSSALLIALVAVASSSVFRIQPASEHALSQAFYYAIIAAGLYWIISILMVITVVGAIRGHYDKEFRLTNSQRTLMLQTISFMVYLLLGALVYAHIENWKYLDAVFWADFTLLTVGFGGDFVPTTHLGRSLLFPYAIGGVLVVGLVVGSIRSLILERGKNKLAARFIELKRERVISSIDPDKRTIKIGLFKEVKFSEKGLTEQQRRRQEFYIMRQIQAGAEARRRWVSFGISATAAFILWTVGAVVFMESEQPQGWSYFVSLYFAYTSLLTIGYGDYWPQSNSGKPVFVFWSLLAVPTLTILISNMGDTVIKSFSDLTIWLGSLTVLPGEHGTKATLKATANYVKRSAFFSRVGHVEIDKPPGFLPKRDDDSEEKPKNNFEDAALDRLAGHAEEEDLAEVAEADEQGDFLERDTRFYHYVLAKEIRALMQDVEASPPKQYTYTEWAYYLKLLGQDESDPSRHRKPPIKVDRRNKNRGTADLSKADGKDSDGNPYSWSWLGTRSPLLSNKTEAEWLLGRLSVTLERELRRMRLKDDKDRQAPPISMADLRKRPSSSSSGSDPSASPNDEHKELSDAELRRRRQQSHPNALDLSSEDSR